MTKDALKSLAKSMRASLYTSPVQRRLIDAHRNLGKPASVIFFTTHKCASTFVSGGLLDTIDAWSDYRHVDYAGSIWSAGDKLPIEGAYEPFLQQAYSDLYAARGVLYGPQRRPLDFPGRKDFKHVFFLRDPRDVLVSSYFSFAFTHGVPSNSAAEERFRKERQAIKDLDIDSFVLQEANNWVEPVYSDYRELRETASDALFLSYQSFAEDTEKFVTELCGFLDVVPPPGAIGKLAAEARPIQSAEKMSHKRSGKTGQFRDKLRPETVNVLNTQLAGVLDYWEF